MAVKKRLLIMLLIFVLLPLTVFVATRPKGSYDSGKRAQEVQEAIEGRISLSGKLKLFSPSATYQVGQNFNVDVLVDSGEQSIYGVQVRLEYNPGILQVLGVIPGSQISQAPAMLTEVLSAKAEEPKGLIYLDLGADLSTLRSYKNIDVGHLGVLGRIQFKARSPGLTSLNFKLTKVPPFGYESKGDTDLLAFKYGETYDVLSEVGDLSLKIGQSTCSWAMAQGLGELKDGLNDQWKAVSFTPSKTGNLKKISIKGGNYTSSSKRITCKISDQVGNDLGAEAVSANFSADSGIQWRTVSFSSSASLQPGSNYQIKCKGQDSWSSLYWMWDMAKGKTYRLYICD